MTISKPVTTTAAPTSSTTNSATTTPREEVVTPTPAVVEEKKQEDLSAVQSIVSADTTTTTDDVIEEPELDFDNYDIDKELLEGGQTDEADNDEGDIVEFADDPVIEEDNLEDTEFPLEPHEQIIALEDQ